MLAPSVKYEVNIGPENITLQTGEGMQRLFIILNYIYMINNFSTSYCGQKILCDLYNCGFIPNHFVFCMVYPSGNHQLVRT